MQWLSQLNLSIDLLTGDNNKAAKAKKVASGIQLIKQYWNDDDSQDGCETNTEDLSCLQNDSHKDNAGICIILIISTTVM